jgi:hypothetical protein
VNRFNKRSRLASFQVDGPKNPLRTSSAENIAARGPLFRCLRTRLTKAAPRPSLGLFVFAAEDTWWVRIACNGGSVSDTCGVFVVVGNADTCVCTAIWSVVLVAVALESGSQVSNSSLFDVIESVDVAPSCSNRDEARASETACGATTSRLPPLFEEECVGRCMLAQTHCRLFRGNVGQMSRGWITDWVDLAVVLIWGVFFVIAPLVCV